MNVSKLSWIDRLPAWAWLALAAVALTPVWQWSAARLLDGSDDPLGIVALIALGVLVARDYRRFAHAPRLPWLMLAAMLAAAAVLAVSLIPALARAVLGVLALGAALMAVRVPAQPMLAFTGLGLLALPLLSSLQFFVGFPLRVVTAEASRVLLWIGGVDAERSGSAMTVAGRLVMVDAPCSGIHMAWVAYFTACVAAAWLRVPDGRFIRRLPLIGIAVLAGNIARNTVLVVKEAGLVAWPAWTHEAIGAIAFIGVCMFVLWYVAGVNRPVAPILTTLSDLAPRARYSLGTRAFLLAAFAALAIWPWLHAERTVAAPAVAVEWPLQYEGRPLRPLALSPVEKRFADQFPGAIARFADGQGSIVLRHVAAPTRMLHPAVDCYRGAGYRISANVLEHELGGKTGSTPGLWSCFTAEKGATRLRVCERILDAAGQSYSDTSSWYWAAVAGRSPGPWQAVTRTRWY